MAKSPAQVTGVNFFAKQLSLLWLAIAVLVVTGTLGITWHRSATDPQNVFWGMLAQNLSTPGVAMQTAQSGTSAGTQELIQFSFGAIKQARTITTLTQNGATVKTQTIELPTHSYTQYVAIKPTAGSPASKQHALDSVLGVWADTSANDKSKDTGLPSIFSQVLLSLSTPFANLPVTQRAALLQEIKDSEVYSTIFSKVKRHIVNGRPQYVYTVQVEPVAYVRMMQDYGDDLGMHELDSLDPASYVSQQPTSVQWTVDVRSRHLVAVTYEATNRQESYTDYGIQLDQHTPAHPVSAAALQALIGKSL